MCNDEDEDDLPLIEKNSENPKYNSALDSKCAQFCTKNCNTLLGICGHEDLAPEGYSDPNKCYCAYSSEYYEIVENKNE